MLVGRQATKPQSYIGHSDHVTSVSFAPDGQSVNSVGGGDDLCVEICGDTSADEDALATSPSPRRVPPQGRPAAQAADDAGPPLPTLRGARRGRAGRRRRRRRRRRRPSGMADASGICRRRSLVRRSSRFEPPRRLDQDGLDQAAAYDAQYAKAAEYEDDDEDEYEQYEAPEMYARLFLRRMTPTKRSCRGPSSRTTMTRTTRRGGRVRRR